MSVVETPGPDIAPAAARRTGAIGFADIVGYTILMGSVPETTHHDWMRLLSTAIRPLAERHGCRFMKSTGDGVAAEFPAAEQALAWALAVQDAARAADAPDRPPIAFRIGIDLGEVIPGGDDIYGASVNIAARLQEHAPPGGVALTETARDALPPRTDLLDIGHVRLRNIAEPVHAFIRQPASPPRVPRRAPLTGRPSIAVMPFDSGASAEADRYFADGVIEDIVLSLGALHDISVIARGATLGWGHGRHDPCVIGRILGVRYALSGSVVRRGGGLRLNAALHETDEGDVLWHDRFDVAERELFAVQDEIVARAVAGIAPSIRAAELRRALRMAPRSLSSYDHTLRALHALDGLNRERFADAETHLEAAIREDPGYATPVAWAAQWHSLAVGQAWSRDPVRDAALVNEMAARAISLDPRSALGHAMAGHYRAYHRRDPASALPFLDRAVELGPNHTLALTLRSGSLAYLGRGPEALEMAERALSLCPMGSDRYYFQSFVGTAQFVCGDYAAAARSFRLTLDESPGYTSALRYLTATLDAMGDAEGARQAAARLMACEPDFRVSRYAEERQPMKVPALAEQLLGALERAGVPA
jgi:adenylate cyclase